MPDPAAAAFVADLVAQIHQIFARLGERETLEAESSGQVDVITLLKLALSSELEAAEIAALWLPSTPDIEAKTILAEQCSDELRHYNLIRDRLVELGEDLGDIDPASEDRSPLFHYLQSLRTVEERIAAGPFACEAVAEVRNAQFISFCHSVGDVATAKLYEDVIHPEEIHHHHRGRAYLESIATTPEIQARITAATHSSLAIADELQTLAEMTTGVASLPMS